MDSEAGALLSQGYPNICSQIRAVIFDLDGTLVSSSLDFRQIRSDIGCPEGVDVLDFVTGLEAAQRARANEIIYRHETDDAMNAIALDGAVELLAELARMDIRTGIVTRNSRVSTERKIRLTELQVQRVITREDAAPKPDPEALLTLSREWNCPPEQCIYVGDYLYDIQAARNANMHAGFYAPADDTTALPDYASGADIICDDLSRLLECLEHYLARH